MNSGENEDNRGKQILAGGAILAIFAVCVVSLLMFWRLIPGWFGESVGMLAGVLSTPFFMEFSFAVIGLLIVLAVNIYRRRKEGDEFVTMDVPIAESGGKSDSSSE